MFRHREKGLKIKCPHCRKEILRESIQIIAIAQGRFLVYCCSHVEMTDKDLQCRY
jgi:hypothetical protein